MADDIIEWLHKFVLTEEEKDAILIDFLDIQPSMNDCEASLLGKIKEVGWNFFKFIFKNKESMEKVWFGAPWLYDKYLLNVHPWEPGLKSDSPIFNVCNMWIQDWNIPLHWMSMDVRRKIGHALGGAIDIEILENRSREGAHMRLKKVMGVHPKISGAKEATTTMKETLGLE
ncbi:hypothetical protein A4A49_53458 [Nicotiana attenuata]|uniref:DUF4283 domain-containing protein n=1 Tax=Nicotiana attenuata TaxID=49451 RepID=A0A1J6ILT1_NICAT|nr:hypothetical protein A4A49_53458 [Nicotiana attenuata]